MFKRLQNNKGFLGISFGGSKKKGETAKPQFMQAPDYPEAEGARKDLWTRLQEFGSMPGYGAITPDWADIWENAQRKVQQYFWGSPTAPGVADKIKASAAGRNVSESPALTKMMTRMGATEANTLSDMATEQATKQAELSEQGRQMWLQSMFGMANMKPSGTWWSPWSTQSGMNWGASFNPSLKDLQALGMFGG